MARPIQVLIADDHPLVRCGVRETLRAADGIMLVGEASRGDEAQRLCGELQPDVLLLDLQMPGATAAETVRYIQTSTPKTRIIILTAYDDDAYVRGMIALGVAGYVLKDEVTETVLTAIRSVMQGGKWFSDRVLQTLAMYQFQTQEKEGDPGLTLRERQVLDGIARGWKNARIATELCLEDATVRHHVSTVYAKLHVDSRGEAILWAKEHGFGLS